MIIKMEKYATSQEIDLVVSKIKKIGFGAQVDSGVERSVIVVFGAGTGKLETSVFESLPGVEEVERIEKPYKLASRDFKRSDTVLDIGFVRIGAEQLVIMAGPCSVEDEKQTLACAEIAKSCGAQVLRGGAYKPRSSPFSFQGLGLKGLKILGKAKEKTGLLVVTEVVSPEKVKLVSEYADILQIGARNMQNYPLLQKVGRTQKPVLLKRGPSASVEEWLMAADYILQYNEKPNVILCFRGITTFDNATRYTPDWGIVAKVRRMTHLPMIADPSHPAGDYRYVPSMANQAIAGGCDGLIVEIHPDPQNAMSDGKQSLAFGNFASMMECLGGIARAVGRTM